MTADSIPAPKVVGGLRASLLVRADAWPVVERWLGTSGLAVRHVPRTDSQLPRLELTMPDTVTAAAGLKAREIESLRLIAMGYDNPRIAKQLGLSVETVKSHNGKLFRKLGARNRWHVVAIAYQRGILGGDS